MRAAPSTAHAGPPPGRRAAPPRGLRALARAPARARPGLAGLAGLARLARLAGLAGLAGLAWGLAGALLPTSAAAQTCTATATATAFGNYSPSAVLPNDSTGTISLNCGVNLVTLSLGYSISLSVGGGSSYATRRMVSGVHPLSYQLYSSALRTPGFVWGNGTGGSSVVSGGLVLSVVLPASVSHTVYGRIPAAQTSAAAGVYSDTITVTITY